jgi:hypothetical protein
MILDEIFKGFRKQVVPVFLCTMFDNGLPCSDWSSTGRACEQIRSKAALQDSKFFL